MNHTIVIINIAPLIVFLVSSPPMKIGGGGMGGGWGGAGRGSFFSASGGLPFHMDIGGGYFFIWRYASYETKLGISLGGLQYQFLAQLANGRPKSVKVNLTNCHREVCTIKFYQIVTYDVLTSPWQFDKMLFW